MPGFGGAGEHGSELVKHKKEEKFFVPEPEHQYVVLGSKVGLKGLKSSLRIPR